MRKRVTTVVGVAVATVLVPLASPTGVFAGTLDQSQTNVNDDPDSSNVGGSFIGVQYFTAGLSGEIDQVDVYARRDPACTFGRGLLVDILPRTSDEPDRFLSDSGRSSLASAYAPTGSVPTSFGWVSVVFSSPAPVSAGGRYSLRLNGMCTSPGVSSPFRWGRASGDPYPGGDGFTYACPFGCGAFVTGFDHTFKTYVAPPPPPPEFTGLVTLRYSQNREMFRGGLSYSNGSCVLPGEVVHVLKMETGPNPILGSAMINRRDQFKLEAGDAKGRFYAEVEQKSIPGGTCLAAKSKTIKVG